MLLLTANRQTKFRPPSLLEFQASFPTGDDCARFLFEMRWPDGWICPKCGGVKYYPIKTRGLYECASCRYQASLTAGTVMHKTRTALSLWSLMIYFMTTDKRGISSVMLGKQLGISQKRAWCLLQKLRKAMGEREGNYRLKDLVELSGCFFGAPKQGGSRKRNKCKIQVLAGLSMTKEGKPLRIKFTVLTGLDRKHLEQAAEGMVAPGARVKTNGLRGYLNLDNKGFSHERVVGKDAGTPDLQSWLQVIVSNALALIGGTYHGVDPKHLQAYLDEFAYRFNRRHRPDLIFGQCVTAVVNCPIWTYADIIGG